MFRGRSLPSSQEAARSINVHNGLRKQNRFPNLHNCQQQWRVICCKRKAQPLRSVRGGDNPSLSSIALKSFCDWKLHNYTTDSIPDRHWTLGTVPTCRGLWQRYHQYQYVNHISLEGLTNDVFVILLLCVCV